MPTTHENDLIAPALGPNRVHYDPLMVWGRAHSDAKHTSNNGRARTWTRNKAEMERMRVFCLLTVGAGERGLGSRSAGADFDTGRI